MSRIGKTPISIPSGVEIKIENNLVEVKGPKGTLYQQVQCDAIQFEKTDSELTLALAMSTSVTNQCTVCTDSLSTIWL